MKPVISILALNTGSSSVRFSLYECGVTDELLFSGSLTRIGLREGRFSVLDPEGNFIDSERLDSADHEAACRHVFSWLLAYGAGIPDAIGHRIVHGGSSRTVPEKVTPVLLDTLAGLVSYAPEHLPQALYAIRYAAEVFPGVLQVACFDTAFHSTMPSVARLYPLPEQIRREGVQRYGFHGLSCEYILSELVRQREKAAEKGKVILAHLGHGASMAAVRDGRSIETTMGFSPAGGLVMGTRTGDLDPGVILFLLQHGKMSVDAIREMVNRQSGLLGVSGLSDDMQELLEAEARDQRAHEAIELFCYQARRHIGALSAVLGGLDLLVFTGGIGECAAEIRRRICAGLDFLGLRLDEEKNRDNRPVISPDSGAVVVRVMKTCEELTMVRQTRRVIGEL